MLRDGFKTVMPLSTAPVISDDDPESRLRTHVSFLSDPVHSGRRTGETGCTDAAFYILSSFRHSGLETRVQPFVAGSGAIGHNIVGMRPAPGSRQYVIVLSYYDGLGELGGRLYPGADANCSGTAALLELAGEPAEFSGKPVNVVYAAVDAHNSGRGGTAELWRSLQAQGIRRSQILMVVNLDTMGSTLAPTYRLRKEYLIALGGLKYQRAIASCNSGLDLYLTYDYYGSKGFTDMFYRRVGEQGTFVEAGIPSVMFTSGITDNTNRTTDTESTLNYPVLVKRVELIRRWIGTF